MRDQLNLFFFAKNFRTTSDIKSGSLSHKLLARNPPVIRIYLIRSFVCNEAT
jgi:hypothetical protein